MLYLFGKDGTVLYQFGESCTCLYWYRLVRTSTDQYVPNCPFTFRGTGFQMWLGNRRSSGFYNEQQISIASTPFHWHGAQPRSRSDYFYIWMKWKHVLIFTVYNLSLVKSSSSHVFEIPFLTSLSVTGRWKTGLSKDRKADSKDYYPTSPMPIQRRLCSCGHASASIDPAI